MDSSISQMFAPLFIGTLLNTLLLGVTSMQALFYFQTYKSDPWWFKILISYLTLAEFMNTACDIAIVYEPLILRSDATVPFTPKFLPADAMITALISTPVQLFMAWRIKKITKSTFLCGITTLAALCSLGGGAWLSITSLSDSPFVQKPDSTGALRLVAPVVIWLAFSGATDILIIAIIAGSLMRKRKRHEGVTADPALDSYINRLVRLSIQAGSLTAFAVLTELVVFLTVRGTTYFFIWDLILSKLYTNSLLTSLNSRPVRGAHRPRTPAPNALFLGESPATTMQTISTSLQTDDIMRSRNISLSDSDIELYQLNPASKSLLSLSTPTAIKPPSSVNQAPRSRYDNTSSQKVLAPFPQSALVRDGVTISGGKQSSDANDGQRSYTSPRSGRVEMKPVAYLPTREFLEGRDLESGRGRVYQSSGRI